MIRNHPISDSFSVSLTSNKQIYLLRTNKPLRLKHSSNAGSSDKYHTVADALRPQSALGYKNSPHSTNNPVSARKKNQLAHPQCPKRSGSVYLP